MHLFDADTARYLVRRKGIGRVIHLNPDRSVNSNIDQILDRISTLATFREELCLVDFEPEKWHKDIISEFVTKLRSLRFDVFPGEGRLVVSWEEKVGGE
jgi:hypothetical protein